MRPTPNHVHRAIIIEWHDGDTVKLDTDQDYETFNKGWHRLYGIDTPELKTPAGEEAKRFVQALAPVGTEVIIVSYKAKNAIPTSGSKEKYGRWLVEIWLADGPAEAPSLNRLILQRAQGVAYFGGAKVQS